MSRLKQADHRSIYQAVINKERPAVITTAATSSVDPPHHPEIRERNTTGWPPTGGDVVINRDPARWTDIESLPFSKQP